MFEEENHRRKEMKDKQVGLDGGETIKIELGKSKERRD